MSARAKAALALTAMLGLGMVIGGDATRAYDARSLRLLIDGPSELVPQRLVAFKLHRLLDLTDAQDEQLSAIFASHLPELEARRRNALPQIMEGRHRFQGEFRAILTVEQKARFDSIAEREDARILQTADAGM